MNGCKMCVKRSVRFVEGRIRIMRLRPTLFLGFAFLVFGFAKNSQAQTFTCTPPAVNQIVCENTFPGTPESQWMMVGSGDSTIQGFATSMSVSQGEIVHF